VANRRPRRIAGPPYQVALQALVESLALTRDIGAATALADWRAEEVYPGSRWTNTTDRYGFIRRAANSFHHPVGTSRIGAVVDEALRVIDASVLPGLPAAMANAAVTAVAEKASDLVLVG
jgi:choline dehydrogenase